MDLPCKQESPQKLCGLTSRTRNTTILLRALNLTQKQCQLFAGLQGDIQIKPNIVDIKKPYKVVTTNFIIMSFKLSACNPISYVLIFLQAWNYHLHFLQTPWNEVRFVVKLFAIVMHRAVILQQNQNCFVLILYDKFPASFSNILKILKTT